MAVTPSSFKFSAWHWGWRLFLGLGFRKYPGRGLYGGPFICICGCPELTSDLTEVCVLARHLCVPASVGAASGQSPGRRRSLAVPELFPSATAVLLGFAPVKLVRFLN